MATGLLRPPTEAPVAGSPRERRPCGRTGRGPTLEAILARAHEGLRTHGAAPCPVCGATMHADGLAGDCTACGSRLS